MDFWVSVRIGSCQICEISDRKKKHRRKTEKLLSYSASSGSHQKQQREGTINYEYITDEKRLLVPRRAREECQPFIRDIIREYLTVVVVVQWLN